MTLAESFARDGHVLVRDIASCGQVAEYRPVIERVVRTMKDEKQGRIDDYGVGTDPEPERSGGEGPPTHLRRGSFPSTRLRIRQANISARTARREAWRRSEKRAERDPLLGGILFARAESGGTNMRSLVRFAAVILVAAMFVGSADASWFHRRVYVTVAPPEPMVERVVVSPGPGYIWQPGYHAWNGRSYVWTAGTWVRPPHRYRQWIPGHWISTRRGYYWEAGHWVR